MPSSLSPFPSTVSWPARGRACRPSLPSRPSRYGCRGSTSGTSPTRRGGRSSACAAPAPAPRPSMSCGNSASRSTSGRASSRLTSARSTSLGRRHGLSPLLPRTGRGSRRARARTARRRRGSRRSARARGRGRNRGAPTDFLIRKKNFATSTPTSSTSSRSVTMLPARFDILSCFAALDEVDLLDDLDLEPLLGDSPRISSAACVSAMCA